MCLPMHHVCRRPLGGFQDSVSGSISSPSDLLKHKVLIKTVQVQQLAIKILIDSVWVSRIPKVRKQSNLDYSVLKYVFSLEKSDNKTC